MTEETFAAMDSAGPGKGPGTNVDRRAIPADAAERYWRAGDGHPIRRFDWAPPPGVPARGALMFLPGRGDAYEKYLESFAYWRANGWHVTSLDWRGQAGSGREGYDALTGHIADFALWMQDLGHFWNDWVAEVPGPHVLIGHSMGGHLALRGLVEGDVNPVATILTAPMLGFRAWGLPLTIQFLIARAMVAMGDSRRPAWRASEKPGAVPIDRIALLTHDEARYADELWWREARPELAMGPASWGWMEGAIASMLRLARAGALESVATPVQIFTTSADLLVNHRSILRAAARLPRCELVRFGAEARHELLREVDPVRDRVLAAIDSFLDREALAGL